MTAVEGGRVEIVQVLLQPDYQCDTNIQETVFHNHECSCRRLVFHSQSQT